MILSAKIKDDFKDCEEIAVSQSKVKEVRLYEKLGKQSFH